MHRNQLSLRSPPVIQGGRGSPLRILSSGWSWEMEASSGCLESRPERHELVCARLPGLRAWKEAWRYQNNCLKFREQFLEVTPRMHQEKGAATPFLLASEIHNPWQRRLQLQRRLISNLYPWCSERRKDLLLSPEE